MVGETLYEYVVGNFSVVGETLLRTFSAHVTTGLVIMGLAVVHIFYLHQRGSNNPLFVKSYRDTVSFHRPFTVKDAFVLLCLIVTFFAVLLVRPEYIIDIDSFMAADPLNTPESIKPEWYFLAFYAMLRCIESKVGGVLLVCLFLFLLWVPTKNYPCSYIGVRR